MKNKKIYFFLTSVFFLFYLFIPKVFANEDINFLSLKNDEVNVRLGPSKEHPVKFIYKKKYLPLEILDSSETWRKVKDFENNSGWIHISHLSKKKSAINKKNNAIIFKKSTVFSRPIAKLETGRLVLIKKCKIKWCKIASGKYVGWIEKDYLWGKIK